jgi:hypothetical protein
MNATLIQVLKRLLPSYTEHWGVFAKRIDGQFRPDSPAKVGQKQFGQDSEDGYEFVATNATVLEFYYACFGHPKDWNTYQIDRAARALIELRNDFDLVVTFRVSCR